LTAATAAMGSWIHVRWNRSLDAHSRSWKPGSSTLNSDARDDDDLHRLVGHQPVEGVAHVVAQGDRQCVPLLRAVQGHHGHAVGRALEDHQLAHLGDASPAGQERVTGVTLV
jgi:hypothetical protein